MVTYAHVWELIEQLAHAVPISLPDERCDGLQEMRISICDINDWEALRDVLKTFARRIFFHHIERRVADIECRFFYHDTEETLSGIYRRERARSSRKRPRR